MRAVSRSLTIVLAAILGAVTLAGVLRMPAADVRSDDRNKDGRPDVWRSYDQRGRLTQVALDTNFDGRSDVEEYYDAGVLVLRKSDRDFNDRVDLVEEFDRTTQEMVRSVADANFDGVADRLVLFQQGQAVYTKALTQVPPDRARSLAAAGRPVQRLANEPLVPFDNPFRDDVALNADRAPTDASLTLGPDVPAGMPIAAAVIGDIPAAAGLAACAVADTSSSAANSHSPRGPPPHHLAS